MSDLENKVQEILTRFQDFRGCVELASFRDFILFNSNSDTPDNIMGMLGMGQKSDITLGYDEYRDIFFSRVVSGPQDSNSLIIYTKTPPELKDSLPEYLDKFQVEIKDPFLDKYFTKKEKELYFMRKKHLYFVAAADCHNLVKFQREEKIPQVVVENYFSKLLGLVAGFNQAKSVFMLPGTPNVIFNFNFSLFSQLEKNAGTKYLIDCFLDGENILAGKTFIEINNDFEVKYLEKVDSVDFKNQYTMIVPIKSFAVPK